MVGRSEMESNLQAWIMAGYDRDYSSCITGGASEDSLIIVTLHST